MARVAGAKNRNTPMDDEGLFLQNIVTEYNFWRNRAKELKENSEPYQRQHEFAEAYKVLINKFTTLEE